MPRNTGSLQWITGPMMRNAEHALAQRFPDELERIDARTKDPDAPVGREKAIHRAVYRLFNALCSAAAEPGK